MAVFGPPGGVGDDGLPMLAPEEAEAPTGDCARGEDCHRCISKILI